MQTVKKVEKIVNAGQKESAKKKLAKLLPFDKWLAAHPNASDFDKELYKGLIASLEDLALNGQVTKINVVTKNGVTTITETRRI